MLWYMSNVNFQTQQMSGPTPWKILAEQQAFRNQRLQEAEKSYLTADRQACERDAEFDHIMQKEQTTRAAIGEYMQKIRDVTAQIGKQKVAVRDKEYERDRLLNEITNRKADHDAQIVVDRSVELTQNLYESCDRHNIIYERHAKLFLRIAIT